jgi:hypothetical protein
MLTEPKKPLIVISYAHADEPEHPAEGEVKWLSFVTGYLRPAIKHGAVDLWLDQMMPSGADWEREIEQKLRACDIFILLVSPHSMSSEWLFEKEIALIRDRQARGEAVYFYPLVLTPTPNVALDLVRDKNLRPRDGKPLSDFSINERYRLMAEVADEIARIATTVANRKSERQTDPSNEESVERQREDATPTIVPPDDSVSGFSPDSTAGPQGPDILEIGADARALARVMCLEGAAPLAIAVLGGWGSGKSSFMERLDREVRRIVRPGGVPAQEPSQPNVARVIERVVQVRFNAWQFVDANLWASLTAEFFDQLRAGGWDRQTDVRYAGLVERVNRHVHALNADVDAKRKIASDSARKEAEAQKSRDKAAAQAKNAGNRILGQLALDQLSALYESQRGNLSALGLAVVGDNTTESVDAVLQGVSASRSIYRQVELIFSMFLRDRIRLWVTLAVGSGLFVAGLLIVAFGRWSLFVAVLSWLGAAGTLAVGLMPALRFVGSVTRRGAEIAQRVGKADQAATAKLLESEIKLRDAIRETEALEADAEEASKRFARYVDPVSRANPPRLLRYVLEDDPDTRALESQLGLIGRTRRLFQAVDNIVQIEREKPRSERADDVPDRVIIYIDDLDRCSEEQVYNVLQAIHLLLAFELFVVVVGVDITRVQTALMRFSAGLDEDAGGVKNRQHSAAEYLDKIFQVAFWVPPLTTVGGGGGSYARYVKRLTTLSDGTEGTQPEAQVSIPNELSRSAIEPSQEDATAHLQESTTSADSSPSLVTITLEPEEQDFLASGPIGRLAADTPRSVKRLVNCYRLIRTRLTESGALIMGAPGVPPLYPLIAFMVALETGQPGEIADNFYRGLKLINPATSLQVALDSDIGEDAPSSIQPLAKAFSKSEALGNALIQTISARGGNLTAGELERVATIVRRFSFNQPI